MTRKSLALACVLGLAVSGCFQQEIKRSLTGQWQYDLPATRVEMERREADFAERNYMESIMAGLQFAQIDFQPKGNLEFQLDSLSQNGRWRLRRNGKEISIRLTEQEQVFQLDFISTDTLLLDPVGGEGLPFPRLLVKKMDEPAPAGK